MNKLTDILDTLSWIYLVDNLGTNAAAVITDMCIHYNYLQKYEQEKLSDGEYFYYTKKEFDKSYPIFKKKIKKTLFQSIIKEIEEKQIIKTPWKDYYKINEDILDYYICNTSVI